MPTETLCPTPTTPAAPLPRAPEARRAPGRVRRILCAGGSLRLAVVLLGLFAACLSLATLIESAYGGGVAGDLVYRTWWFVLLLAVLAANVVAAALKKYPWKRHQTGFLITHAGLLVLLLGGLLTTLAGTEGQVHLIDTDDPEVQQTLHLPQTADTLQLAGRHRLEVYRVPDNPTPDHPALRMITRILDEGVEPPDEARQDLEGCYWPVDFTPGTLPWRADAQLPEALPWGLRLLRRLADPFPGFTRDLDGLTSLSVHNFYPHSQNRLFSPAAGGEQAFAALRVRLTTPLAGRPLERWLASLPEGESDPTPVALELLALHEPALLGEFLRPPDAKTLGKLGQLVLAVGERRTLCRVALDGLKPGKAVPLPGTGLTLTLRQQGDLMALLGHGRPEGGRPAGPACPAVQFDLSGPEGSGTYLACARLPALPALQRGEDVTRLAAWYHTPDWRRGDAGKLGAVQFLQGPDDRLYYRVYGKEGLRQPGRPLDAAPGQAVALPFKPMELRFEVTDRLPRAARRPAVVPCPVRPGAEPPEPLQPALRCTLQAGSARKEFWVRLSRRPVRVQVGNALFFVRYRHGSRPVDFTLALRQARQVRDPGSDRPARYESDVTLAASRGGRGKSSAHRIAMNRPLNHGPYKVFQTNYRPLLDPRTGRPLRDRHGRPVSLSGLTVAHDPGLWLKYAGSVLLVLGIATMFLMRAYFFKPRQRA